MFDSHRLNRIVTELVRPSMRPCMALCFVAMVWLSGCTPPAPSTASLVPTAPPEPLPPITAAPAKNAQTDLAYIGTERCAACHRAEETSYHHTAHSRALAEIDLDSEPPDGEFSDPVSQRHYRIYRQEGRLHQEE